MPQQHYEDDVTILAPLLAARLDDLTKHIDHQFGRLEAQIDGLDKHWRRHNQLVETRLVEHERRLSRQETEVPWRWGAIALSWVLAFLGIRHP